MEDAQGIRYIEVDVRRGRSNKSFKFANAGVSCCHAAAAAVGNASVAVPVFADRAGKKLTDWNDLHVTESLDVVAAQVGSFILAAKRPNLESPAPSGEAWAEAMPEYMLGVEPPEPPLPDSPPPPGYEGGADVIDLHAERQKREQAKEKPKKVYDAEHWEQVRFVRENFILIYGEDMVWDVQQRMLMKISSMRTIVQSSDVMKFWGGAERMWVLKKNIVFDPTDAPSPAKTGPMATINLFQGWKMKPKKGNCVNVHPSGNRIQPRRHCQRAGRRRLEHQDMVGERLRHAAVGYQAQPADRAGVERLVSVAVEWQPLRRAQRRRRRAIDRRRDCSPGPLGYGRAGFRNGDQVMLAPRLVRAAELCKAIYNPVAPGVFAKVFSVAGVNAGVLVEVGLVRVVFAGSECDEDWVRDFKAVPVSHPKLGIVHAGFLEGMPELYAAIMDYVRDVVAPSPVANAMGVYGHSLGCAHGTVFAGLCAVNGVPVAELIQFAPPRASYQQLRDIVTAHVPMRLAFRNGFDPVPELPPHVPALAPWVHTIDPEQVTAWPACRLAVFDYHSIALYIQAMQAKYPEN